MGISAFSNNHDVFIFSPPTSSKFFSYIFSHTIDDGLLKCSIIIKQMDKSVIFIEFGPKNSENETVASREPLPVK